MDEAARDALVARGLDDIFDPSLRSAIGELIDDVRERGDHAVCDALSRFDGVDVEPDGLRVSDDEFDAASVSGDVDAAIDDALERWWGRYFADVERDGPAVARLIRSQVIAVLIQNIALQGSDSPTDRRRWAQDLAGLVIEHAPTDT